MNPKFLVMIGVALLAAACTGPRAAKTPAAAPPVAIDDRPKLKYSKADALSKKVKVGMPQSQIESMFGRPDRAAKEPFGRATEKPWVALVWEYVYHDVMPPRALTIVFQESEGEWLVNHGSWNE